MAIKKTKKIKKPAATSEKTPWLLRMLCPVCKKSALKAMPKKKGEWGAWGVPGLVCSGCKEKYPVTDGGVLRMIPKGDYKRYEYWEKMHQQVELEQTVALYRRRFSYDWKFLNNYYNLPRVAKRLGWKFKDSLELGCGWGTYTMSLAQAGIIEQPWLLDISRSALKGTQQVYRKFGMEPFLIQGEIHHLPFRDNAFEVSLSGGLYEHFVDEEQEQLVRENARISKKILTELPESSTAYWIYRKLVTWKFGEWPFGFEVPLDRRRMRWLYERCGARCVDWDYHNLGSAVLMALGDRWPIFQKVTWRPAIFYFLRHDLVVAVDSEAVTGPQ